MAEVLRRARRVVRTAGRIVRRRIPGRRDVVGLPPREDSVALVASLGLAEVLAPEWRQHRVARSEGLNEEMVAGADLVLVEWSGGPGTAHDITPERIRAIAELCEALGTPLLVWDTMHGRAGPVPALDDDIVVLIDDPARREMYRQPVAVLGATFQQRRLAPGDAWHAGRPVRVVQDEDDVAPGVALVRAAASGAAVVTNCPDAAAAIPGVIAVTAGDASWTDTALRSHPELRHRHAVRSTRAAHREWSASARADTILESVGRSRPAPATVSAVVPTMRPGQLDNVLEFIARQEYPRIQLVLVTHGFTVPEPELTARAAELGVEHVVAVPADSSLTLGACMNRGIGAADGQYVAKMDDDNFYGRHYLADLMAAFAYTDAQVVGKWAHLTYLSGTGAVLLRFPGAEHRYHHLVQGGTMLMPRDLALELGFEDLPRRVDTTFLEKVGAAGGRIYSTDRFGFVSVRGASAEGHTWRISDTELLAKPSRLLFYGDPWDYADV